MVIYIAIGGALGFAVREAYAPDGSCAPYHAAYGLIESHCRVQAVNMFWFGTIAIPRFLIAFPALAIALVRATPSGNGTLAQAGVWLLYSIPVGLVLWFGTRYWLRLGVNYYRVMVCLALSMILAEIVVLGFQE